MQLRLQPKRSRNLFNNRFVIKTILFAVLFCVLIFALDKIEMRAPSKIIKQEISNDKLITVK